MIHSTRGRPPHLIEIAAQLSQDDPGGYFGPWLLALTGISFMLGILVVQSTKYFSAFGYEGSRMFTLVVSCILLSILQWVIIVQASMDWFAYHFGDRERFSSIPWQSPALQLISRLTVFVSQLFFVYRCYSLYDRSKLVLVGLMLGTVTTLTLFGAIGVGFAIDPFTTPLPQRLVTPALCMNLGTDLAITILTLWKLGKCRSQSYSRNTESVIRRLRNATVEAAVPPAICAILNLVFYMTLKNLTHNWFVLMTPRFYVWAMMFTLNSRVAIRRQLNSPNDGDEQTLSTGFQFANRQGPSSKYQHGDLETTTVILATIPGATHIPTKASGTTDERGVTRGGPDSQPSGRGGG